VSESRLLRFMIGVSIVTVCALLVVVGAVVIPQQSDLLRRQDDALKNHEVLRRNQIEILQRLSMVEGQTKTVEAVMVGGIKTRQ